MRAALAALALSLALAAAGCGLETSGKGQLRIGAVEVRADSAALRREAERALRVAGASGDGSPKLYLEETTDVQPTSLTGSGRATKRRLRYVLSWSLVPDEGEAVEGDYRYSQLVDNDDTTHRANKLADRRFFDSARRDGIRSMVAGLAQQSSE